MLTVVCMACIHMCIDLQVHNCVCVCMCMFIVCLCVHVCVCVIYIYIYMCVCKVCGCVRMHTCTGIMHVITFPSLIHQCMLKWSKHWKTTQLGRGDADLNPSGFFLSPSWLLSFKATTDWENVWHCPAVGQVDFFPFCTVNMTLTWNGSFRSLIVLFY